MAIDLNGLMSQRDYERMYMEKKQYEAQRLYANQIAAKQEVPPPKKELNPLILLLEAP